MALYGAVPFMLCNNPKGFSGVFWNNPSDTFVDLLERDGKLTHWISEAGVIEMLIFVDKSPNEVVKKYTLATGPPALPLL
mmetsp:Transcript_23882/g.3986  ORF Transcript_23882/g.3986 Transcript_23882/m.3986 type:complete len:80 (-) Transcript_23882:1641-1880(-)